MKCGKKYISPRVDIYRMDAELNIQLSSGSPTHSDDDWSIYDASSFNSPFRSRKSAPLSGGSMTGGSMTGGSMTGGGSFSERSLTDSPF